MYDNHVTAAYVRNGRDDIKSEVRENEGRRPALLILASQIITSPLS